MAHGGGAVTAHDGTATARARITPAVTLRARRRADRDAEAGAHGARRATLRSGTTGAPACDACDPCDATATRAMPRCGRCGRCGRSGRFGRCGRPGRPGRPAQVRPRGATGTRRSPASAAVPRCPPRASAARSPAPPLELRQHRPHEVGAGQPRLRRAVDRRGHPPERAVVLVPVQPDADVDLCQRVEPHQPQRVDQQAQLDPVAHREGQPLQQRPAHRVLAAKRLHEAREQRPVQVQQGACHQLRDPAALPRRDPVPAAGSGPAPGARAQRAVVHRLDELQVRVGHQRADDPRDEVRRELPQIRVDETHHVARRHQQRAPQHVALAAQRGQAGQDRVTVHHSGTGQARHLRRTVRGPGVDDHQLVHERHLRHQFAPDHGHDLADRLLLVERGQHHAHRGPACGLGHHQPVERPVVDGPGTAGQPAFHLFQHDRFSLAGPLRDPSRVTDDRLNRPVLRLQS